MSFRISIPKVRLSHPLNLNILAPLQHCRQGKRLVWNGPYCTSTNL